MGRNNSQRGTIGINDSKGKTFLRITLLLIDDKQTLRSLKYS